MIGPILLPYQQRLFADRSRVVVVEKSRRIGATWALAAKQVDLAARSRRAGGRDCIYQSTSQRLGRTYIRECSRWVGAMEVAARSAGGTLGAELLKDEIRFASGHSIKAIPSNPEAIRGEGGDTLIDEGAHHLDLEELLAAADAVGDWGGSLTIVSTHSGDANPFARLVEEVRAGERPASLHRITIHDALADGLHRRRCELRGEEYTPASEAAWLADKSRSWGFAQEYEVIPSGGGGQYIRRSLVEEAASDACAVVRLEPSEDMTTIGAAAREAIIQAFIGGELAPRLALLRRDRVHYLGGDVGRSGDGDLSAFTVLEADTKTSYREARLVVELRGVPFDQQWDVLFALGRGVPHLVGGGVDKVGIGAWLAERAELHLGAVRAVPLTKEWYLSALPKLRVAYEEGALGQPDDQDLATDVTRFRIENGRPFLPKTKTRCSRTGRQRHADFGISLALANEQVPLPGIYDFRSAQRTPLDDLGDDRQRTRGPARGRSGRRQVL